MTTKTKHIAILPVAEDPGDSCDSLDSTASTVDKPCLTQLSQLALRGSDSCSSRR
jgi:hypothetical protein